MAWRFPDGQAFDLSTVAHEYLNCRFVEKDEDTLTVEYDQCIPFNRMLRLRVQVRVEDVRSIHEHAISAQPEASAGPSAESAVAEVSV